MEKRLEKQLAEKDKRIKDWENAQGIGWYYHKVKHEAIQSERERLKQIIEGLICKCKVKRTYTRNDEEIIRKALKYGERIKSSTWEEDMERIFRKVLSLKEAKMAKAVSELELDYEGWNKEELVEKKKVLELLNRKEAGR